MHSNKDPAQPKLINSFKTKARDFPAVLRFRLWAPDAGGTCLIPGEGTKIQHAPGTPPNERTSEQNGYLCGFTCNFITSWVTRDGTPGDSSHFPGSVDVLRASEEPAPVPKTDAARVSSSPWGCGAEPLWLASYQGSSSPANTEYSPAW